MAEEAPCQGEQRAIALRQGRFALDTPDPPRLTWKIPVRVKAVEASSPAEVEALLEGDLTVALGTCGADSAATANAGGIGYYRVSYAAPLFAALADRFARLEPADQLTLQSDAWALGEAGLAPVSSYLDLTRKTPIDADVSVWQQMLDTLSYLDEIYQALPQQAAFRAYVRSLLAPLAARLGWGAKPGEPVNDALLRERALTMLGLLDDPTVVAEAQRRFRAFQEDPASLPGALRMPVLRIVGAHADPTTYDALRALGRGTGPFLQKRQIYDAIVYARDPMLAQRTLALSLTDEAPAQLRPNLVRGVASVGRHPGLAWPFLRANFDAITAYLDSLQRYTLPAAVASNSYDERHAAELRDFAEQHIPTEARAEANKAVAIIGLRARTRAQRLPGVNRWLESVAH